MKNKIQLDEQIEEIEEVFDCQKYERNGKTYLEFKNSEGLKNLIKFNATEMTRIQYSEPKTRMIFSEGMSSSLFFEGLGWIELKTTSYLASENSLTVIYEMLKEEQLLGSYELQLSYLED